MSEPDPAGEPDSLGRSLAVDQVAEAFHAAIVRYALRRGETPPVPWWELDHAGKNRIRAAVVAMVTTDRPALSHLLMLVGDQ